MADRGALISAAPPGTTPEPYRFPLRNRLRADVAVPAELPLADGTTSTELRGPADAQLVETSTEAVFTIRSGAEYIALQTDGPQLNIRRGSGDVRLRAFTASAPRFAQAFFPLPFLNEPVAVEGAVSADADLLRFVFEKPRS